MPTLILHAKPLGAACQQALTSLQLPNLSALLRLLTPGTRQTREEDTLSPLHEMVQAQALGLQAPDGLLPWAALQAQALQLPAPAQGAAWAWLTPCHWQVNADHVRMADPADTQISADESQRVMESMQAFLAEDGIYLHGQHGDNWLAQSPVFKDLPTASLARASGGAVDHWLPRQAQAQVLRKLQNEMQMLLYSHPVNDARAARGLLPINSMWVSGTGNLPADFSALQVGATTVLQSLAEPLRRDDAPAWLAAWQALDRGPIQQLLEQARQGQPVELTLCGETAAQTFALQARGLWSRIQQRFASTDVAALLQSL
jgi:hypothetical protein